MRHALSEPVSNFIRQLGCTIRDVRREQGLRQRELGARCGIEGSRVGEIERGVVVTSVGRLRAIATALGLTPAALLRRQEACAVDPRREQALRESLVRAVARLGPRELEILLRVLPRLN